MMASAARDAHDASPPPPPHNGTGSPRATPTPLARSPNHGASGASAVPSPLATPGASPRPPARRCLLFPPSSSSSAPSSTPLSTNPTPLSTNPTPPTPLSAHLMPTLALIFARPPPTPTQTPRHVARHAMPPLSANFLLSQPPRHGSAQPFGPPSPMGPMLGQKLKHQQGLILSALLAPRTAKKPGPGRPKGSTSKTTTGTANKKPRVAGKTTGAAAKKSKSVPESDYEEEVDELAFQGTRPTRRAKSAAGISISHLFQDYPPLPPPDELIDSDFEPAARGSRGKTTTATWTPATSARTAVKAPAKGKNTTAATNKNKPRKVVDENEEEDEIDELEESPAGNDDGDDDFLPTPTRPPVKPERTSARLRHEPAANLSVPATRKRAAPRTKRFIDNSDVELDGAAPAEDPDPTRANDSDDDTVGGGEPPRKKRAIMAAAKESLPVEHPVSGDLSDTDDDDGEPSDPHTANDEPRVELTHPLADPPRPPPSLARGPSPALPARRAAPAADGGGTASRSSPAPPAPARARLPPKLPPQLPPARQQLAGRAVSDAHRSSSPAGLDAHRSSSPAPPPPPPRAGSTRPARSFSPIAMSLASSSSSSTAAVAPRGSKSQAAPSRPPPRPLGMREPLPAHGSAASSALNKAKSTSAVLSSTAAMSQQPMRYGLSRSTSGNPVRPRG
ncbi:hypothetical protein GGF32_009754 [Allomyces javanicus]|nr:hypothetical protein GGF32_009754 [Allomyces javanicus]